MLKIINRLMQKYILRTQFLWLGTFAYLICGALITQPVIQAMAQADNPWMPDQRIPGYRDDTYTPFLLADQNGYVHAFASQVSSDGSPVGIVYRKWSLSTGWTSPIDILLSPSGDAIVQSAFLDSAGMIHLVFYSSDAAEGYIYYSSAYVGSADSITAWLPPMIVVDNAIPPPYAALAGDDAGNLVMIYTGDLDGNGVYSTHSSDSGLTWSKPVAIYLTSNPILIPFTLRLSLGQNHQAHASWSVVTNTGVDVSLHYARFDFQTSLWTAPVTLSERLPSSGSSFGPSYPSVVDNGSEVIVMYNNGNPLPSQLAGLGRPIQMVSLSKDNGDTWEPPSVPFIRHEGRSGEHVLVKDSDNVVHALFVQRTAGGSEVLGGIWESEYQNGYWSDPIRYAPTYSAHDLRAVVSQGYTLLLAWRMDPGEGQEGIWFTYKILNSKALPLVPYLDRESNISTQALPTLVAVATATRTPLPENLLDQPREWGNPGFSFTVGFLTVSFILFAIIMIIARSRNRPEQGEEDS